MIPPLKHILCVDDDPDILMIARLALETVGGFQVSTCQNSSKALAEVKSLKPDMILMDAVMPGMDGPTTLKTFQVDPEVSKIPVFFMTGSVRPHEIQSFLGQGASGVIHKPFDPMTLAKQVEELWAKRHKGI